MRELARTQLYRSIPGEPEQFGLQTDPEIRRAAAINFALLKNIEDRFLTTGENYYTTDEVRELFNEQASRMPFFEQLEDNIERFQSNNHIENASAEEIRLFSRLDRIIAAGTQEKPLNEKNLFNKLLNELAEYNNSLFLKVFDADNCPEYMRKNTRSNTQVFLSYAFADKLYSFYLFQRLYKESIYLYVDWMHNGRIDHDGRILKETLHKALVDSKQLLFLRSHHSELHISGNTPSLRSWCSWELGNYYYGKNGAEKYLENLYEDIAYRTDPTKSPQLHGLKLLSGFDGGRLVGSPII